MMPVLDNAKIVIQVLLGEMKPKVKNYLNG